MKKKELKEYVRSLPSVADQDVFDLPTVKRTKKQKEAPKNEQRKRKR